MASANVTVSIKVNGMDAVRKLGQVIEAIRDLEERIRPFDNGGAEGEHFADELVEILALADRVEIGKEDE